LIVVVSKTGEEPRTIRCEGDEAVIGKRPDCAVVLSDDKVSRRHARLVESAAGIVIEDLGSTNGTIVNGDAIAAPSAVGPNDEIRIGGFTLSVGAGAAAAEAVAPVRAEWIPETLSGLFADAAISEIMINGPEEVFFERAGLVGLAGARFESEAVLDGWVRAIAARAGRPIDDRRPMLDARLPDGSRVNAILPPLSLRGPCVTIRRFPRERLSGDQLVDAEALTRPMLDFLRASVAARLSLLVSGGTGSGKTTLLNALAAAAGADERVVTIEDAAELRLPQRHVLPLETRPADATGQGEVTVRELVRNALRMRPDRIVVGEVRGAEALDMLQAMNTGHEGSLSTIHANSPREALSRLETLVLFAGTELPVRAVREQIAGAIPLVVHVARTPGGRRRVTSITELTGLEGDRFTLGEIFRFDAASGAFQSTGYVPRCRERLVERGQTADPAWFSG
jgi:pilus assembly protein CpaF